MQKKKFVIFLKVIYFLKKIRIKFESTLLETPDPTASSAVFDTPKPTKSLTKKSKQYISIKTGPKIL